MMVITIIRVRVIINNDYNQTNKIIMIIIIVIRMTLISIIIQGS